MAFAAQTCVDQIRDMLASPEGLAGSLAQWVNPGEASTADSPGIQVLPVHIGSDLAEKQARVRYPVYLVYCSRIENRLREKFRRFSGSIRMVVEVRVSADRPESLQQKLHLHTEAALDVLERNRGALADGLTWGGAYEVNFQPIRHGGANYLQGAQVTFELDLSRE
jgi:hypothetical protein